MRVAVFCVLGVLGSAAAFGASPAPVFTKDVLPILQSKCQGCHRPGEIAPMSFLTYKDVRPWAKAIREAVLVKKMPPWFADPHYGKFRNDQSLNQTATAVKQSSAGIRTVAAKTQEMATSATQVQAAATEMAASVKGVRGDTESLATGINESAATIEEMARSIQGTQPW